MAATEGAPAVPAEDKKLSIVGVAVLGIGSMVGAGIFALLGEAAAVAGSAVWLSFLLAGVVTILLAYNVIKLGIRCPSSGGLIEYLRQGFGNGRLLGVASWLGYAAAFVIVTAMVAVSFGSYAVSLFGADGWSGWDNVFTSAVIVLMTAINIRGTQFVARVASALVFVLLAVFALFIAVTITDIDFDLLAFSGYPAFSDIVASVALTFFAFLGFGVMTFAVGSLRNPDRELPRAMLLALGVTGVAGYRRRSETGANLLLILLGLAATVVVLVAFILDTLENAPQTFAAIIAIAVLAVAADSVWKRMRPAEPTATPQLTSSS